ncbi:MAG: SAF domain-containing protein, partial [Mycobacteriales bacterium]
MREPTFVRKDAASAHSREEHAVSDPPASPRASRLAAPGWLDTRLVLGVLLVLASVVVGARVLSSADRSQTVWVLTRDLAPGAELTSDDLTVARVRLFTDGAEYI